MAKYTVTCADCGEEFTVQLVGPHKTRDWKLNNWEWVCDECARKRREEQNRKAAESNSEAGLPALEGSQKQVAWAESIRQKMAAQLKVESVAAVLANRISCHSALKRHAARLGRELKAEDFAPFVEKARDITSASWYIDNRYNAFALTDYAVNAYMNAQTE